MDFIPVSLTMERVYYFFIIVKTVLSSRLTSKLSYQLLDKQPIVTMDRQRRSISPGDGICTVVGM